MMLCYKAIPKLLQRTGHTHVFGMLGGSNVGWVAEGVRTGAITLIKSRHEESAVQSACGFGRVTGTVGICTVTHAPGFANAMAGLIVAKLAHLPLLLIVSESPAPGEHSGQSVNQRELTEALGAGFHHVDKAIDLPDTLTTALRAARWNGSPQVLSLATDLLLQDVDIDEPAPLTEPPEPPDGQSISTLVDALATATRPLIVAGQGAVLADCRDELFALAHLVGARVATTLRGNRFFDGHPHDLGICGTWAPQPVRDVLAETDVFVGFGAGLNERTMGEGTLFGGAKVFQCEVDVDQDFHASRAEYGILGDARDTARAIIAEWTMRGLNPRPVQGSSPSFDDIQRAVRAADLGHDPARGLDLRDVYLAFDRKLPPDRVIVTDSGRALATSAALTRARDARSWVLGRGYGTVGLGVATAVGAAVAAPDRPVTLFCGDGGFMMGLAALDTARLHNLNLNIVINNDQQLGSEVKHLNKFQLPYNVIGQSMPNIVELAGAYGGRGYVIYELDQLESLTIPPSGLNIFDCRLDPNVDAPAAYR